MSYRNLIIFGVIATIGGCSCGDDDGPGEVDLGVVEDGATPDDSGTTDGGTQDAGIEECGNSVPEDGEECDDGNDSDDDLCLTDCTLACGDGVVNAVETCDTGIADGEEGACPASCDDGMACTADVAAGSDCAVTCMHSPIAACVDGDGCCAPGCTATNDDDCSATCGNGTLEAGETCEAGVGAGCPTSCDDTDACTMDALIGDPAMCTAECTTTPVTACADGDGCCPSGCDSGSDDDCSASCGSGVLDPGETCEPGVGAGCPTSCDDGMACTGDVLSGSGCMITCAHPPITACVDADGCCAPGCDATNDDDCAPMCGNSVVEPGETCDDGNTIPDDGCDACVATVTPTAFRMTDLDLLDPHAFTDVFFACRDITNTVLGQPGVNPSFQDSIQNDGDSDGNLDLSFVVTMEPLDQTMGGMGTASIYDADCTAPMSSTSCMPSATGLIAAQPYTSQTSGGCLGPLAGTTGGSYTPAVSASASPCFQTTAATVSLVVGGIAIPLRDAQIGATYVGTPATSLANGLLRGFITVADAEAAVLPADLPQVGGDRLATVLRGYPGNSAMGYPANCASGSDMDTHPTLGDGWYFYLAFPAAEVPWTP